jgi:acetyl-CoA synthetase
MSTLDYTLKPHNTDANLKNYEEVYKSFRWDAAGSEFSWHADGLVNIGYEAIDRHADNPATADTVCLSYSYGQRKERITYRQMKELSARCGTMLRRLGVESGDRVFLFLPRIPEFYIALAACAKIGAIIAPLYSEYRDSAVKDRMLDGQGKAIITTPQYLARVPVNELPDLQHIILVGTFREKTGPDIVWWQEEMEQASPELAVEWVEPRAPLLLTYTSGPTGKPIGLLHPHDSMRGYRATARWVLDLKDGDVLWTQAEPGWLMNVVYSAFAPWLCGIESVITGRINSVEECYRLIEEYKITVVYTIPTIYRMMAEGAEAAARCYNLQSLRHLLSALEPLTPELIYSVLRILELPIHDTWWTAETGMITIANFPSVPIKPGYLGRPCPGIRVAILDAAGKELPPFTMGEIALSGGWPALFNGIWENEERYRQYFIKKPWFISGDRAFIDFNGTFFYQGRADDVIITSGGRIGPDEIENVLTAHPAIAEAGVIRIPDETGVKKVKAYVCLKPAYQPTDLLKTKIISYVENQLSPETSPREIEFCDNLPKTVSGKILRRVLKAWEWGLPTGNIAALKDE